MHKSASGDRCTTDAYALTDSCKCIDLFNSTLMIKNKLLTGPVIKKESYMKVCFSIEKRI